MKRIVAVLVPIVVLLFCSPWLTAGSIYFHFATGVDNGSLVPSGQQDVNFSIVSSVDNAACSAANPCPTYAAIQDSSFPWVTGNPVYLGWEGNGPTSQWIAPARTGAPNPNGDVNQMFLQGTYQYQFQFTINGLDQTGLSDLGFSGTWWADNSVDRIWVNGTSIPILNSPAFVAGTNFDFAPGSLPFQSGLNTLIFDVWNGTGDSPSGFRLEADLTLPEPATFGLIACGLVGLFALRRLRKA